MPRDVDSGSSGQAVFFLGPATVLNREVSDFFAGSGRLAQVIKQSVNGQVTSVSLDARASDEYKGPERSRAWRESVFKPPVQKSDFMVLLKLILSCNVMEFLHIFA